MSLNRTEVADLIISLRQWLAEEGLEASRKTYDWEWGVEAYEQLFLKLCGTGTAV